MTITQRPRALVTHLIHLTGTDPVTARMFMDSAKTAKERLGIKPVTRRNRIRTTARSGRHTFIKPTGETTDRPVIKGVRRRVNVRTGRHTFAELTDKAVTKRVRRRHPVRVYHYTRDQVIAIVAETKPRKAEYKALKEVALIRAAEEEKVKSLKMRHLPRHKKWSKRRNKR